MGPNRFGCKRHARRAPPAPDDGTRAHRDERPHRVEEPAAPRPRAARARRDRPGRVGAALRFIAPGGSYALALGRSVAHAASAAPAEQHAALAGRAAETRSRSARARPRRDPRRGEALSARARKKKHACERDPRAPRSRWSRHERRSFARAHVSFGRVASARPHHAVVEQPQVPARRGRGLVRGVERVVLSGSAMLLCRRRLERNSSPYAAS